MAGPKYGSRFVSSKTSNNNGTPEREQSPVSTINKF